MDNNPIQNAVQAAQDIASGQLIPKSKKKLILLLVVIVAILTVSVLVYLMLQNIPKSKAPTQASTATSKVPNYTDNLEKAIKTTFADSKYKAIIDYTNLASREKDLDQRYNYYVKIFNKISQAYGQTKNPQFKLVLYQLKDYIQIFPQYKEADTLVPK